MPPLILFSEYKKEALLCQLLCFAPGGDREKREKEIERTFSNPSPHQYFIKGTRGF